MTRSWRRFRTSYGAVRVTLKWWFSHKLLAEVYRGEHGASSFYGGLEVSVPSPVGCGGSQQPQNQRFQDCDEAHWLEAVGAYRSSVTQREPPPVAFDIGEALGDLHALRVDASGAVAGAAVMGLQCEQPRGTMLLPILCALDTAFARSARCGSRGAHRIHPTAVPRTAESGVGDHEGAGALGQHRVQSLQKLPVGLGAFVATHRMDFVVDRNRPPRHRHRGFEDELRGLQRTVGPVHDYHRALNASERRLRQRPIHAVSFPM